MTKSILYCNGELLEVSNIAIQECDIDKMSIPQRLKTAIRIQRELNRFISENPNKWNGIEIK